MIEEFINWRRVSKAVSDNKSETAIRSKSCPVKYEDKILPLIEALQEWHSIYVLGKEKEKKLTVSQIKEKLNNIEW